MVRPLRRYDRGNEKGRRRCALRPVREIVCSVVDRPTRSYAKLCSGRCRKMANTRRAAQQ